jgi:hypothetical protein
VAKCGTRAFFPFAGRVALVPMGFAVPSPMPRDTLAELVPGASTTKSSGFRARVGKSSSVRPPIVTPSVELVRQP